MSGPPATDPKRPATTAASAGRTWLLMSDLVLDNERRREVADTLGISFARARALRRLARKPMSMSELAAALDIDPPNATTVVDDLETQSLVRRKPHPTDRRARIVEATRQGKHLARRADAILSTPPPELSALEPSDLQALQRILETIAARRAEILRGEAT